MRLLRRILWGFVLVIVGIVVTAFAYDRYASARVLADYPPPGDMMTVNGLNVHTICKGSGDTTLILFHGFAGGAIDMLLLMEALQDEIQVCAFDRPGNDYSSPLPVDWSIDDVLAWHHAVINALTDDPVYVAGHSLGGAYALAYAAQYPTRGVISLDGLSPTIADTVVSRMGTYGSLKPVAVIGLLRPLAGIFVSPDYADTDLYAQMTALRSRSSTIASFADEGALVAGGLNTAALSEAVANLDVPLLILVSEQTDVPEGKAFTNSLVALDETYPQSTQIMIPGARHYLIVTHVDQVADAILAWIATQDTAE